MASISPASSQDFESLKYQKVLPQGLQRLQTQRQLLTDIDFGGSPTSAEALKLPHEESAACRETRRSPKYLPGERRSVGLYLRERPTPYSLTHQFHPRDQLHIG